VSEPTRAECPQSAFISNRRAAIAPDRTPQSVCLATITLDFNFDREPQVDVILFRRERGAEPGLV
jgi:hypothetical protein